MAEPEAIVEQLHKAAAPKNEVGVGGLYVSSGRVQDELLRDLQGDRGAKIFREMADNDATVGALLFAIEMMLREVGWHLEPNQEAEEAAGQEVADFVQSCLDDMSMTWTQTLSAIVTFFPYGWSYLETVYKIRQGDMGDSPGAPASSRFDDHKVGWRKWPLRIQESLWEWVFDDNGGVQGMKQRTTGGDERVIPIERALLFRTTIARGSPEGRSILRTSYRAWYFKKRIEETEGIGIERDLAGLPVAHMPIEYLSPNATPDQKAVRAEVEQIIVNIRRDSQEGVLWPADPDPESHDDPWQLELLTTGGSRQFDTSKIIERWDTRILMTALADFILLGHTRVGARAVADPKMSAFGTALAAWLDEIAGVVNDYAIPRLMRFNAIPEQLWPKLVHDEVKQVDLASLAAYMKAYFDGGGILDAELDAQLRQTAGWPELDPDAEVLAPVADPNAVDPNADPNAPPDPTATV